MGYELWVSLVEGRFTNPNIKIPGVMYWLYVRSIRSHRRRPPSSRKMGLRHRVLPTSFQRYGLWVAFLIPVVSMSLIKRIPYTFSKCGTLLRKPPTGPECISSVCSRLSWWFCGKFIIKYRVLRSTSYLLRAKTRISYQPGDRCCTLHTLSYFTLDLGVERTHRQSARRLPQPVNGNNLLLLVDTSIRALQGLRLPSVSACLQ